MSPPSHDSSVDDLRSIFRLLSTAVETLIDDRDMTRREDVHCHVAHRATGATSRSQYDAVKVIRAAMGSLESLIIDPHDLLLDFSMSYLRSRALHIAAEKDIAATLARAGPEGLCSSELARISGIQDGKLRRLMRVLVSNHVFAEVEDGHFANNHISQVLADDVEFRALIVTRGQVQYAASDFLPTALSTNQNRDGDQSSPNAFQLAARTDLSFFAWLHQTLPEHDTNWRSPTPQQYQRYYMKTGSERRRSSSEAMIPRPEKRLFNAAMGGLGRAHDRYCLEDYPWTDLNDGATVVDVGGGIGTFCMRLHSTYPKLNVVVQDKAPVIEQAAGVWKDRYPKAISQGTAKLMTHDFFQVNPVSGAEVYWLRHILHDWGDDEAIAILSHIRDSMTSSSSVLIAEILMTTTLASDKLEAAPQPLLANYGRAMNTAHAMDLNMMAMTEGKERSPEEYERIVQAAGLKTRHVKCTGERPQCARCIKYGVNCPGYIARAWVFESGKTPYDLVKGNVDPNRTSKIQALRKDLQVSKDGRKTESLPIRSNAEPQRTIEAMAEESPLPQCPAKSPSLPLQLPSSKSGCVTLRGFQYFRENTIPSFLYVNPSPQALYVFQYLLPQSYHTEPAIEQAVIAIASAQELAHAPVAQRGSLEATLLRSYGRTLQLLGDPRLRPSVLVMMLACFVFVGFETFRESPRAASLHLQSGLRLLRQWKSNLRNAESPSPSSSEDHIISHYIQPVFAGIEVIFSRSSISDIVQVGDLEYHPPVLPSEFGSLLEARGKMIELWMYFFSKHPPEHIDAVGQLQALPLWEKWHVKLLQFSRNSTSWPVRAQLHACLLHVFYDMVSIALQCQRYRDETVWDKHIEDFEKMFQTCYEICQRSEMYLESKDPNDMGFGMLPGVLPPLWLLGMNCRDPMMRRRAAELIRRHHRQCGQVDECSAAVLVDAVIQLEEEGIAIARTCSDVPEDRRVRVLESDLTKSGKMTVVFTRTPYTQRQTVDVAYSSNSTLPSRPYRLWPIVASMDLIGYHGLIRATGRTCVCKVYGQ